MLIVDFVGVVRGFRGPTLATPFPALCPRILGTRFTNYGLRMFWGELMVI